MKVGLLRPQVCHSFAYIVTWTDMQPRTVIVTIFFPINRFLKTNTNKLAYNSYNNCFLRSNMSSVRKKGNTKHKFFLLPNCLQVIKRILWMTLWMFIFDGFDISLLEYRIEFSRLYNPQRHYFIRSLWLWNTGEYVLGSAWSFGFFIPATTANDLRLRRIFYPRFYPLHLFYYLNSWEKDSIFLFECSVLNKGTTCTIFITSLVWRGPWLGIEPGTSRTRSQH